MCAEAVPDPMVTVRTPSGPLTFPIHTCPACGEWEACPGPPENMRPKDYRHVCGQCGHDWPQEVA